MLTLTMILGAMLIGSGVAATGRYIVQSAPVRKNIKTFKRAYDFLYENNEHPVHDFISISEVNRLVENEKNTLTRMQLDAVQSALWMFNLLVVLGTFVWDEIKMHRPHKHLDLGKIREEEGRH